MTRSTTLTLRRSLVAGFATAIVSLALLALAACGAASSPTTSQTQVTVPDAASVVQRAEAATLTDATFNVSISETVNGAAVNITGTGKLTSKPAVSDVTLQIPTTVNGKSETKTVEQITDKATSTIYTRSKTGTGQFSAWSKSKLSSPPSNYVNALGATDFASFQNPTMIGADTINNVAVWHLQSAPSSSSSSSSSSNTSLTPTTSSSNTSHASATATAQANAAAAAANVTSDLFIRQDNNLPARWTVSNNAASSPVTTTIDFTAFNAGNITISIPK